MAASVKQVAARAGVSLGTVSNVLNSPDRVSAATAAKVHKAIEELGFVRNDAARQLRAGHSRAIGMVILDIDNPFFTDLARGAEQATSETGLVLLMATSDESPERELRYLEVFEEQRVLGVLVSPVGEVNPKLRELRDRGIGVVLVDRVTTDSSFSSVSVDDVEGGKIAAEHLVGLGRKRIAFVGGPIRLQQVVDRFEGANQAIQNTSTATLEYIATETLSVAEGRRAAARILAMSPRPDAVFAANDLVAVGLLQGIHGSGKLRVPEDLAIIGYDDISFAESAIVPLSSIRQPSEVIGRRAVQIMLEEVAEPGKQSQQIRFEPELIVRASTQMPES